MRGRVGHRHLAGAHRAGAGRVQRGLAVPADPVQDLLVGRDLGARGQLAAVVLVEARAGSGCPGRPAIASAHSRRSVGGGQVVEPQRRVDRPGRARRSGPSRGSRSTSARCAPGSRARPPATSRRSGSRSAGSGTSGWGRPPRRCCGRSRRPRSGWWRPGPPRRKSHFAPTMGRLRSLSAGATDTGCLRPVLDVDLEMVLQVLADAGQVGDEVDAEIARAGRPGPRRTAGAAAGS